MTIDSGFTLIGFEFFLKKSHLSLNLNLNRPVVFPNFPVKLFCLVVGNGIQEFPKASTMVVFTGVGKFVQYNVVDQMIGK